MDNEERYYWRLWGEIFRKWNIKGRTERESLRKEITEEALGFERSHKDFTHSDYDIVLSAMRRLYETGQCVNSPSTTFVADIQGENRRFIWIIKHSVPDSYARKISRDKFGSPDWENLNHRELKQLFYKFAAQQEEENFNRFKLKKGKHANPKKINDKKTYSRTAQRGLSMRMYAKYFECRPSNCRRQFVRRRAY